MSNVAHKQPDPFFRANPLSLELLDNDGEAKLIISDNPGGSEGRVSVRVKNVGARSVYLANGSGDASPANHHFAVSFKPGVLSQHALNKLAKDGGDGNNSDWSVKLQKESYWETLYLLRTKAVASGHWKLDKEKEVRLLLDHLTAGAAGGARGSRVQLRTNPNMVSFDNAGKQGLQESVGYNFEIVSHHGKRDIPLHIGFIGTTSNMVLNDGSANTLTLRVTNTGSAPLPLKSAGATSFTLKLDTGSSHTADQLTTSSLAAQIKAKVAAGAAVAASGLDKAAGFVIGADKLPDKLEKLGSAGDHFDIVLSDIKTTAAAGLSNLYIDYNVPGYWSGQVVCQILKTPLIYFTNPTSHKTFTGIGTLKPISKLQIDSDANHLLLKNSHGSAGAQVHLDFLTYNYVKDGVHPTVRIMAQDDGKASSHLIFSTSKPDETGPSFQLEERLRLTSDGKLGIGIDQPQSMLAIAGGATVGDGYKANTAPANGLLVQGYVGIGTPKADHPLHLKTGKGFGLYHTDGTNDVGTWVGKSGDVAGGWVGTKSNVPLVFFTHNSEAQVVLETSGRLQVKHGLNIRGSVTFDGKYQMSYSGSVADGAPIHAPDGNINNWNILVSIKDMGFIERGDSRKASLKASSDNGLVVIQAFTTALQDKKGWIAHARYLYAYGGGSAAWHYMDDDKKRKPKGVATSIEATIAHISYLIVRK